VSGPALGSSLSDAEPSGCDASLVRLIRRISAPPLPWPAVDCALGHISPPLGTR